MSEPDFVPIRSWSESDQPRYKLREKGSDTLSESELLAILIGSGSRDESAVDLCKRILRSVKGDLDRLARLSLHDLMVFKGIGEAKAIAISAALELGRRRQLTDVKTRVKVVSSRIAYDAIAPLINDKDHEEFWILLLSRANVIIDRVCVSTGGVSGTVVDSKIIFKMALQHLASGIILCHNHPSGQLKPSKADLDLTRRIKEGAGLIDIQVLDHLIIGQHDYLSMADEGLIF